MLINKKSKLIACFYLFRKYKLLMGENVLNISIVYIYPDIIKINNEINLFRIIDNNIKETIVLYAINTNNKYQILMINTMTGDIINICNKNNLSEIDNLINKFKSNEENIKNKGNLEEIQKYILKIDNI